MQKKPKNRKTANKQTKSSHIPELSFKFSDLWTADYRLIAVILIVLPLLVYVQVYDFPLVWDDNETPIGHLKNPFVLNPSWQSFGQLFSEQYFGMYIPVSYLFWGGLKWLAELLSLPLNSVLHLSNVGVHIINGLLVFTVLKQFVVNKWALLIGVLFFLLHPIQVEAVAWVSEFRNLLAFAFSLSALYVYLKNQTRFSYTALLLFILAVLSKLSAVVLPLIIFTINYFYYGFSLRDNFIKALPFLIITLFIAVATYLIQSNYSDFEQQHTLAYWQRPFAWLDSIVFYVSKFIYPYHLGASYTLSPKFIAQQWWFYPLTLLPLALAYFNRAIKLYPADAKKNLGITLNHRGGLFFGQRKYQKALADFSQAVVLDPSSNDSNSNNIGILFTLKRCKQAYLALDFARKNKVKLGKPLLTGLQQNCPRQ